MRRFAADSFPQLYLVDSRERSTRQYSGIRAVEQVHFWEAYWVTLPAQCCAMPVYVMVLSPVKGKDTTSHACRW